MSDRYQTGGFGGVQQYFGVEHDESGNAVHFRGHRQEMRPVFDHVKELREKVNQAPKSGNPHEWRHIGSVPWPILLDWLKENHYRVDQFARNEDNCKDKFLTYFISRDFSKFHNQHFTTKESSSQIVVPYSVRKDNG